MPNMREIYGSKIEYSDRPYGALEGADALVLVTEWSDFKLWPAQITAIRNLEASLAQNKPRALIQMATGSGKTFTAISFIYRLIKFGGARRVLFLVDRGNLGRQRATACPLLRAIAWAQSRHCSWCRLKRLTRSKGWPVAAR
jgi:predicted helicase